MFFDNGFWDKSYDDYNHLLIVIVDIIININDYTILGKIFDLCWYNLHMKLDWNPFKHISSQMICKIIITNNTRF